MKRIVDNFYFNDIEEMDNYVATHAQIRVLNDFYIVEFCITEPINMTNNYGIIKYKSSLDKVMLKYKPKLTVLN